MSRLSSTTLQIGDAAPLFSLPTLDGARFQLGDALEGGIGLLVFAPGSWSPGSRQQISELTTLYDQFLEARINLAMIVGQDGSSLRRRLETRPPFPVLIDADRSVIRDYGVFRAVSWDGIGVTRPAAFVIDREGSIRFLYVGERDTDVPDAPSLLRLATWLRDGITQVPDGAADEPLEAIGFSPPIAANGTLPAAPIEAEPEAPEQAVITEAPETPAPPADENHALLLVDSPDRDRQSSQPEASLQPTVSGRPIDR